MKRLAVLVGVVSLVAVGAALAVSYDVIGWGQSGDVPVKGDFNGDGKDDVAVFRNGEWYIKDQPPYPRIWGQSGDIPVPADYDGDGTTDIAVFRPSEGRWYILKPDVPVVIAAAGDICTTRHRL